MTRFLFYASLLLICAMSGGGLLAQTSESYDSKIDGARFRVDSSCRTVDSIFNTLDYGTQITSTYLVRNSIILELVDNPAVVYPDSFDINVSVAIDWTDSNNILNHDFKTLRVEYNNRSLIQDTLRSFYEFMGAHIVVVKITGIVVHHISLPLSNIIRLVNRMELYRDYFAKCGEITVLNLDANYLQDQDELLVSWEEQAAHGNLSGGNNLYSTADEYDLEWTFYDDSSEVTKNFVSTFVVPYGDEIFKNNCTRVTIKSNSYLIPLLYEKGILLYRVRAVRIIQNGIRIPGEWSNTSSGHVLFRVGGHEKRMNWQGKTSFAEEGKRKSVANYFDGSSHSRQIVTKINTDSTAVVAETIYDWEGRPVVNTLPAPTISKLIKHFALFNKDVQDSAYTWRDLDSVANGCNNPPRVMSISNGSSQYYSPNNASASLGFNQYIPNAFGYPFSQTAYTSDLTNRIRRSSGPGKDHKMGTEHVTTYYYGGAEASELKRLFANEAGQSSHYFKNLVVDPNGQVSVTYQDMHGRTIATALAGYPSPLDSVRLDTIPDFKNDTILYDAILDTVNNLISGISIICTKTFTAATASNYTFMYKLLPDNFSLNSCDATHFCFNCIYDLKIIITDDCNNKKMPGTAPFILVDSNYSFSGALPYYFDTLCGPAPIIDTFRITLPIGEYTVTKKLSIKKEAIDFYFDYYVQRDTCLKTFDDFYDDALQEVDLEGCQVTCTACLQHLGDSATFCSDFLNKLQTADSMRILYASDTFNAYFAYQELKHACDMLCDSFDICEHKRAMMLADMSPGGQYGIYTMDSMSETFSCGDSTSIFFNAAGNIYNHRPLYSDSSLVYRNGNKLDTIVADFNHDGVVDSVLPNSLTPVQFVQYWKPSWAETLLPYHPEYCYYQFCVANSASNNYDEWLRSISTYDTAVFYHLINPLDMPWDSCHQDPNPDHQDPFFTAGGLGFGSNAEFKQRLMRYATYDTTPMISSSIWDISSTLIDCSDPSCTNCMKNYYWNVFRNMYLGRKKIAQDSIMKVWGAANCGDNDPFESGPRSPHSWFRGKEPRFEIVDNNSAPLGLYSKDTVRAMHRADSLSADSKSFSCRDYASYWWMQLSGCGIPNIDSMLFINELIAVCDFGTDAGHPMGATSVRPGSETPNGNKTFEEVLHWASAFGWTYHKSDSCTSLLITNPLPNSAAPLYYQTAQIDRPEPCVCANIAAIRFHYQADSTGYTSFSDYLYKKKNISISQEDITILIQSCDSSNVCQKLPHPVTLPYQFGCNVVCANCYQIITAYNSFLDSFPGVYNSPNYFRLMQSSMNSELGMNLTVNEYFSFMMDSCHFSSFPYTDTVPCHGPIAHDDTVYIGYAQPLDIAVTANDMPAGAVLIDIIKHSRYGTEAVSGTKIYYSPFSGYTIDKTDTLIYTTCNHCDNISCDTASVYIHIAYDISRYSPPIAVRDTVTVCREVAFSIDPIANDVNTDSSNQSLGACVLLAGSSVGTISHFGDYVIGTMHIAGVHEVAYSVCTDDPLPQCTTGYITVIVNNCAGGARMAQIGYAKIAKGTGDISPGEEVLKPITQVPTEKSAAAASVDKKEKSRITAQSYIGAKTDMRTVSEMSLNNVMRKALMVSMPKRLGGAGEKLPIAEQNGKGYKPEVGYESMSAAIHARINAWQKKGSNQKLLKDLPYDEIFRNVGVSGMKSRVVGGRETLQEKIWDVKGDREEKASASQKRSLFKRYLERNRYAGRKLIADGLQNLTYRNEQANPMLLPAKKIHEDAVPGDTMAGSGPSLLQRRSDLGGGRSLSGTGWCDSLEDAYNTYVAYGGLVTGGEITWHLNWLLGNSHFDDDSSYMISNTYSWWRDEMAACGISCLGQVSCDTLVAVIDRFHSGYPAGYDSCSPEVLTTYLNAEILPVGSGQYVPYEQWVTVYACCSISLPAPDVTIDHCDSMMLIDYEMLNFHDLLGMDTCLPSYFWDYFIQVEYPGVTIQEVNTTLALCSSFRTVDYCHTTPVTHCDSVRNVASLLEELIPLAIGSEGVSWTVSLAWEMQFGEGRPFAEIMHEISACDTGRCAVILYTKAHLDSIHFGDCWQRTSFTAAMNSISGYHYTSDEWCARVAICGLSCAPFCPTTVSWCDSVTAAYNYYLDTYGNSHPEQIVPFFNALWGAQHYEDALPVDNTLSYWFDRLDTCGLSCHALVDCDTLEWAMARFDSIYPIRHDSCPPGVLTTYLISTFYPSGDGPDYDTWMTLYGCCGIHTPAIDTFPTHCDSLAEAMFVLGIIGLPDSCLPEFAWSAFISESFPGLGVTSLAQLQAELEECGHFPPLAACDTMITHCDSVLGVLPMYHLLISFDGGDGGDNYELLADIWHHLFGDTLGIEDILSEIGACQGDSSLTHCDSVLAAIALYQAELGDGPDDPALVSEVFSEYYGHYMTPGQAYKLVFLCTLDSPCAMVSMIDSLVSAVAATYGPCIPEMVAVALFNGLTENSNLFDLNDVCTFVTHCRDSCYVVCPEHPETPCDSLLLVTTAWAHIQQVIPDINVESLEALGRSMLHDPTLTYDTIIARAIRCSAGPPCLAHDTVRSLIDIYLAGHPGIRYAGNYPDVLYNYLDSALEEYSVAMHVGIQGAKWCAMMLGCGDSCPPHLDGPTLCNRPLLPPVDAHYTDSCNIQLADYAFANAAAAWTEFLKNLHDDFEDRYVSKCLGAYRLENFAYEHPNGEYHYTLYYYDQAGNLVKTIPPAGVDLYHQHHTMATRYRYNTLNQVVEQLTPDAGRSLMWYDRIGKVVLSQNARQKPYNQFAYTKYDPLQRITEVGRWYGFAGETYGFVDTIVTDPAWYGVLDYNHTRTEVTKTWYDHDTLHIHDTLGLAENLYLRNRVASTTYADIIDTTNIHNYQSASHYRYDIHGNVEMLLQENTALRRIGQQWKKMSYDYDLISGKVNQVRYQQGKPDMFIHQYEYDADNRLTDVRTTRDSVIWDHDASYSYYTHGPLARMELGDAKVQAENYVYTIQGWLKGVNGLHALHNIANDGATSGINHIVAQSEMGYGLNYYLGDYQPIAWGNTVSSTNSVEAPVDNLDIRSLYNGNIAMMQLHLAKVGQSQAYRYRYDQLNRLTGMDAFSGLQYTFSIPAHIPISRWNSAAPMADYAERVNYDPNGNIAFYNRHGNSGTNIDMDSMLYRYLPGTNKLDHVDDRVSASNYSVDIDDQDTLNYRYDQIGNLTRDTTEGIDTILWTLYGKILEIDKHNGDTIKFAYDPSGHRIMKEVYKDSTQRRKGTYYTHDASGNMMATYEWQDRDTFRLNELMMYGSSRLGSIDVNLLLCDTVNNDSVTNVALRSTGSSLTNSVVYHTYGIKHYELSNHLGNVLATITDRHIPTYTSAGSGSLKFYNADVSSAQDYYPFGMQMPGRIFDGGYRFGFNGKEQDPEVIGQGNQYDYGFRIYNPRLGKFLSVDPLTASYPWYTPYQFAGNKPIVAKDLDGLEDYIPSAADIPIDIPVPTIHDVGKAVEHAVGVVFSYTDVNDATVGVTTVTRTVLGTNGGGNPVNLDGTEASIADNAYSVVPVVSGAIAKKGLKLITNSSVAQKGGQFALKKADDVWQWGKSLFKTYTKGIVKLGGSFPLNFKQANNWVNTKSGHKVYIDENGFPDFSPFSQKDVKLSNLSGEYKHDEKLALAATGMEETPKDMVWHHHQDGKTMQLVPKDLNNPANGGLAHTGGAAVIKHNNNPANVDNQVNFKSP